MTRPLRAAAVLLALAATACSTPFEGPAEPAGALPAATPRLHAQIAAHPGLTDQALLDAIYEDVRGHTSLGYKRARQKVLHEIDRHAGRIECIYTGLGEDDATMNVEHSWPQSKGAAQEPARSDLHHLFAAADFANGRRGNWPFGETACDTAGTCKWSMASSSLGDDAHGVRVFEVRPSRRGDVARALFYFAVRYRKNMDAAQEGALRSWNDEDPPDADERARNDAVEALQHNRNPFVDDPGLVGRIADF